MSEWSVGAGKGAGAVVLAVGAECKTVRRKMQFEVR